MAIIEQLNFSQAKYPITAIRVGRFNKGINTTFIIYAYRDILIDTGPINQWRYVKPFINSQQINHTLITHHHEDHSGNALNILTQLKIPLLSNPLCQKILQQGFSIPPVQKIIWGNTKPVTTHLLSEDFISTDGLNLKVILTPGHTDDMSCFYDNNEGFLFTGDLYIASKVRYLHKDEDLAVQIKSLNKVLKLDFTTAFCPHRGIMKNGKQDITNKRDFILDLAGQVKHLYQQGVTITQIQKQLLGKEDMFTLVSSFDFSKKRLIEACCALPCGLIT